MLCPPRRARSPAKTLASIDLQESPDGPFITLINNSIADVNMFIQEIANFIDNDVGDHATTEIMGRLSEYDNVDPQVACTKDKNGRTLATKNADGTCPRTWGLFPALNNWWYDGKKNPNATQSKYSGKAPGSRTYNGDGDPSNLDAARAESHDHGNQRGESRADGADRRLHRRAAREREKPAEARRRGPGHEALHARFPQLPDGYLREAQNRAYIMSRALSRSYALEATKRRWHYKQSRPGTGVRLRVVLHLDGGSFADAAKAAVRPKARGTQIKELYGDYANIYCVPGEVGCKLTTKGPMSGKERDIGASLWGENQTEDQTDPRTRSSPRTSCACSSTLSRRLPSRRAALDPKSAWRKSRRERRATRA